MMMIELLVLAIAVGCLGWAFQLFLEDIATKMNIVLVKPFSCALCLSFWLSLALMVFLLYEGYPLYIIAFAGVSAVVANRID